MELSWNPIENALPLFDFNKAFEPQGSCWAFIFATGSRLCSVRDDKGKEEMS